MCKSCITHFHWLKITIDLGNSVYWPIRNMSRPHVYFCVNLIGITCYPVHIPPTPTHTKKRTLIDSVFSGLYRCLIYIFYICFDADWYHEFDILRYIGVQEKDGWAVINHVPPHLIFVQSTPILALLNRFVIRRDYVVPNFCVVRLRRRCNCCTCSSRRRNRKPLFKRYLLWSL